MDIDYRKYYQKSTVSLSQYTKETLNSMKKGGQTYDNLIRELIDFWKNKHLEYWTRRKDDNTRSGI